MLRIVTEVMGVLLRWRAGVPQSRGERYRFSSLRRCGFGTTRCLVVEVGG